MQALFEFWQSEVIWPFSSDIWHQQGIFFSQSIDINYGFWNTQTSAFRTKNHTTFNIT